MAQAVTDVRRLMTMPGVDMVVAVGLMTAIGKLERFASPNKLVAYFGLNPSVRQSGEGPAYHGRITKRGCSLARRLLVETAWQTVRDPRADTRFLRALAWAARQLHRGGRAVARKLAALAWHLPSKGEDYASGRSAPLARRSGRSNSAPTSRRAADERVLPMTKACPNVAPRSKRAPNRRRRFTNG